MFSPLGDRTLCKKETSSRKFPIQLGPNRESVWTHVAGCNSLFPPQGLQKIKTQVSCYPLLHCRPSFHCSVPRAYCKVHRCPELFPLLDLCIPCVPPLMLTLIFLKKSSSIRLIILPCRLAQNRGWIT